VLKSEIEILGLDALRSDWSEGGACQLAEVHAFRGEADAAFTWLHTAPEQNDPGVFQLRLNPIFETLHDDPRWRELLDQLGLADEQLSVISFDVLEDPPGNAQATAIGT
jgi:hypothetical protein